MTRSANEAMALANRFAPEHLVVDREALARHPLTAGAVFIGPYAAQAAVDSSGEDGARNQGRGASLRRVAAPARLAQDRLWRRGPDDLAVSHPDGLQAAGRR